MISWGMLCRYKTNGILNRILIQNTNFNKAINEWQWQGMHSANHLVILDSLTKIKMSVIKSTMVFYVAVCFLQVRAKECYAQWASLRVIQMTDPSGIWHSLGRPYRPVSSDTVIHLERNF